MKFYSLVIFCLLLQLTTGTGQEFPLIPVEQSIIQPLPQDMTFEELTKLKRELNWKRIFAASLIPGYIHFYAGHSKLGWSIAGIRSVGFGMIGYSIIDEFNYAGNFSLSFIGASDSVAALASRSQRNLYLFLGGIAINLMAYAFDWAHGDYIIENEKNTVLYKFGIRRKSTPAIGLWYDSRRNAFGSMVRIPL